MHTRSFLIGLSLVASLASADRTFAWGCGRSFSGTDRFGGSVSHSSSTSGGWGDFSHSGSTSYTTRDGQSYSTSHSGSGTYGGGNVSYSGSATGPHGGTASYSGSASAYGYHGAYYGYHGYSCPPPCCYGSYGSGFGAGMVTGAALGAVTTAAVASAAKPPATTYVYSTPGVYVAPPVVVGAPLVAPLAVGTTVTVLPAGFTSEVVNGIQYYQAGATWYQMRVVGTSVQYVVVPAP